jgi:acetyl esterase/lipase
MHARMFSTLFITATLVSVLTVGPAFAEEPLPDSAGYQYSQPREPTFSDISYATLSPSEKFDLYLPAASDRPAPLIIWIHGGAFSVGDKRSMPRRNFGPPPKPVDLMGPRFRMSPRLPAKAIRL